MRSSDELNKYLMVNSVTINLDVFSTLIKMRIVSKKDCSLVIITHGHAIDDSKPQGRQLHTVSCQNKVQTYQINENNSN